MKLVFNLFVLIVVASFLPASLFAAPKHATILHFNDLHGHLMADGDDAGGAARLTTIVREIEAANRARGWATFVLFGGDAFTGTLISSTSTGAAEFDFLNLLGIDAFVIGNHDFDYGLPRTQELIAAAKFPVISANIYIGGEHGDRLVSPSVILEDAGVRLGVVGVTIASTGESAHPDHVVGLRFTDEVRAAKAALGRLKKETPFRIALTHEGVKADVKLAKRARGFSAVIGGHDHVEPNQYCRTVRHIPVCQTPANAAYVGRLDFEIDGQQVRAIGETLIPVTSETSEDSNVARLVHRYDRLVSHRYNRIIGRSAVDWPDSRTERTALGTFICEAMRVRADTDATLSNSGMIRSALTKGAIRLRDLHRILPYGNNLVRLTLTGAQVQAALDHGIARGGGAFPQTAGIDFDVDTKGRRAINVRVDGSPIDPARTYTVATSSYLAAGGDGYAMLTKAERVKPLTATVFDATADRVRLLGVLR